MVGIIITLILFAVIFFGIFKIMNVDD